MARYSLWRSLRVSDRHKRHLHLKAYKSLQAYNYFFKGYVRTVLFYLWGDFGVLKAKVNPSQRSADNCQEAWVALSMSDGSVKTAHWTCMAG